MSNRQRRDGDRRPSDRSDRQDRDRRDSQPDDEQQRRPGDADLQESDSLTALKAILGKVATLLPSLKLNQDECVSLVEQLYGSVLDMDLKLAGETDDKRKASVQAHIQNTNVTRSGGKLVVEFPKLETPKPTPSSEDKPAPQPVKKPAPTPSDETPEAATATPKAAVEPASALETPPEEQPEPQPEPMATPEPPAAPAPVATPEPPAAPEPSVESAAPAGPVASDSEDKPTPESPAEPETEV